MNDMTRAVAPPRHRIPNQPAARSPNTDTLPIVSSELTLGDIGTVLAAIGERERRVGQLLRQGRGLPPGPAVPGRCRRVWAVLQGFTLPPDPL